MGVAGGAEDDVDQFGLFAPAGMRASGIFRRGGAESAPGCCRRSGDIALSEKGLQPGPERRMTADTVK